MGATTIDEVIEIDCQQGWARPHEGLAPPAGIELKIGFGYHVLPAVVVEFID
jgi:hypothetical protein